MTVNQIPGANLINHRLSGLQAAILTTALNKRVSGAQGCDVSQAELLAEIWGWAPRRELRWTEQDARKWDDGHIRAGDTRPSRDVHGAFNHVPRAEYRAARASLSRAITRLEKRMLLSFANGTWGTYGGGLVLTPHGEEIARLLVINSNGARDTARFA